MRSDESKERRTNDLDALRGYLNGLHRGQQVPMATWYQEMARLGLGRSDRQRLSDLRKEGYDVRFDRKVGAQVYYGFNVSPQGELSLGAA